LGGNFDQDGKLITDNIGNRIDGINGLYKINAKYNTKEAALSALGPIRMMMMYGSNADIINQIRKFIPELATESLNIKWAFVSKSKSNSGTSLYSRFNYGNEGLENMTDN